MANRPPRRIHRHKEGGDVRAQVAVVGGETLLGREVREALEASDLGAEVRLFSTADEQTGFLTAQAGEAAVMNPLRPEELSSMRAVFLTGSPESGAKAYLAIADVKPSPPVIDIGGGLEDNPEARLRAPMSEAAEPRKAGKIQIIAHPAAIALALFLKQLRQAGPIRRVLAEVFEPASERGQAGIEELQRQTAALLSFQKLKKDVFDAQIAFNLLPRYGSDAPVQLEDVELRIDRHLATLLSGEKDIPPPSLRLIQAPVFHGYSFSVWAEFERRPGRDAIAKALASRHIDLRMGGEEAPSNVGAAGQSGVVAGAVTPDRNDARACWFWLAADNFKLAADNAVEVAREILAD